MKIIDRKPALFEKTTANIWTDAHIQQQMLKEHLNPSSDGASRRKESILKIVDFIVNHTNSGNRLLDLGCGPGLYTSILKDKGYEVTGIDFNSASITYAINNRKDITYLLGDYITSYPQGKYDAAIMIYCDLGTHSDQDRDSLLKNIYDSLENGGVFIFDVFNEGLINDKQESKSWDYSPAGGFWTENPYLLLSQTFHYPAERAFAYQYNLLTNSDHKHFIVWDRYYDEKEISDILRHIGFSKVTVYPNVLGSNNFTSGSEMFIVAEKC